LNPAPFNVQSESANGVWVVAVSGELDLNTAPRLEQSLAEPLEAAGSALVVDLSECEFIDSTGIALIVRAWKQLDGDFALCCVNDQVQRLLDITGLDSSIPTHGTRDEAIGAVSS
jgi:anti-sigma B factor antagonist